MTFDDLKRAFGDWLFADFLDSADVTLEQLQDWFEHGIPAEYAHMFEKVSKGRVPSSKWPKLVHPPNLRLTRRLTHARVNSNMNNDHRLAISEGRHGERDVKFKNVIRSAKPKGYSQNTLAEAVGVTPAFLSMCRTGARGASKAIRTKVEKLTGWPASDWKNPTD